MHRISSSIPSCTGVFIAAFTLCLCLATPASAQGTSAQGTLGFNHVAPSIASGEERNRQPDLWVMEVQFRSLRMIWAEMKNPETGEMRSEPFLYLPYRAYMRPVESPEVENTTPRNQLDPRPQPPMVVPTFWLIPQDADSTAPILDVVLPEVQQKILVRERLALKNSVDVVSPVPGNSSADDPNAEAILGVAIFQGVDLSTDRYVVRVSGFSNGYKKVESPDGSDKPLLLRKSVEFEIWRPGDRFDATENEFRYVNEPKWVYLPDPNTN